MVIVAESRPNLRNESAGQLARYVELIALGFSSETSAVVAEAPVSLHSITRLLLPDAS